MSGNQEERIKFLIRESGLGIEEAIDKLNISKQTFYNNIRKSPLPNGFVLNVKEKLGIDLEKGQIIRHKEVKQDKPATSQEMAVFLELWNENRKLNQEIKEMLKQEINTVREVNQLKEELRLSEERKRELEDQIKKLQQGGE